MEGKGFRDGIQDFQGKNLAIFGVSFDSVEKNRAFAEKYDFPFDLLCDTDREMGVAYHACEDSSARSAKRISYLIDAEGRIAKAYASVKPAQHPGQVLQDLDQLGTGG